MEEQQRVTIYKIEAGLEIVKIRISTICEFGQGMSYNVISERLGNVLDKLCDVNHIIDKIVDLDEQRKFREEAHNLEQERERLLSIFTDYSSYHQEQESIRQGIIVVKI